MSFSEALARKIEARFRNLETSMVRYRRGTVVAVDPLQVGLGASGSPVAATTLAADLAQDDDVHVAAWGNDMLVLGKTTSDPVTALPDPAYNNQETLLEVDTAGTYGGPYYWHCKYRAATSGSKWHVIGAPSLRHTGSAQFTGSTANVSTYTTWTDGPTITVPVAGVWQFDWSAYVGSPSAVLLDSRVAIAVNGTVAANQTTLFSTTASEFEGGLWTGEARLTLAASDVVTLRVATNGNSALVGVGNGRVFRATPVRIG